MSEAGRNQMQYRKIGRMQDWLSEAGISNIFETVSKDESAPGIDFEQFASLVS